MAKPQVRSREKSSQRVWLFALALIAITAAAYLPAWNGKLIWDDNRHITQPALRSWQGLADIWTRVGATQQYYPLVHSFFWIEQKLWGDSVLGYHLVNILLHSLGAVVLLQILRRLKIPGAWLAAALFALHPVQVESVAWISELKNTLSGLFFFCSILTYLNFDERRNRLAYISSLALFILGLLCKTAIAPLPAIIAVVLWWKRGRVRLREDRRLREPGRPARANFHRCTGDRVSIVDLTAVSYRRARLLVLLFQTRLADKAHFHLPTLAH